MICVVGVNRSMNALNAPVRNSNERNSEFSFLPSANSGVDVPATEFEGFDYGGDFFEALRVEDLAL